MPGRNPTWATEELILALDLYVNHGGWRDDLDPSVIELSELLNSLPIHTTRPDVERFRNPNGVSLKLANFMALDPDYPGAGMQRGGRRDAEVWDRYARNAEGLAVAARAIRQLAMSPELRELTPEDDEADISGAEGRLLYRSHRRRERDRDLVQRKKRSVLKAGGRLDCEVCGFDFAATYGELGEGYIECHHLVPLAVSGARRTRLADLALLCANCHRMVHRRSDWTDLDGLRSIVAKVR